MVERVRSTLKYRRNLFEELTSCVRAMRELREGRLTLRTSEAGPINIPPVDPDPLRVSNP